MHSNRPFCVAIALLAIGLAAGSALGQRPTIPPEPPPEPTSRLHIEAKPLELPRVESNIVRTVEPAMVLSDFEQSAISGHPAIGVIAAQINAAQWRHQKAGVLPDMRIGYIGEEMGTDRTAGFQGGYFSQRMVTGKKLQLDQAVVSNEVTALHQQLAATQQRVVTDVRKAFFAVLVAQERIDLQHRLVAVAKESKQTLKTLFDSGEGRLTDHLQARTVLDTQSMSLLSSQQAHNSAWRELIALSNIPDLAPAKVTGDLFDIIPDLDWDVVRETMLAASPEVAQAMAIVQREKCAIARASAERYPDVTAQVGFVTDNTSGEELVSVQASMPLPRKRRVRAEVGEARSRLTRAHRQLEVVERRLSVQLAREFRNYEQSRDRIARYREQILPRVQEIRELNSQAYKLGETSYIDLLISQRKDFQVQATYLDEIAAYWNSYQRLDGLLLDDSLLEFGR